MLSIICAFSRERGRKLSTSFTKMLASAAECKDASCTVDTHEDGDRDSDEDYDGDGAGDGKLADGNASGL